MADTIGDIATSVPIVPATDGSQTLPDPTETNLEQRCERIRSEIKTWERDHLAKTGRKVTREDVKANPSIVAKYEEYENIRAKISGKKQPHKLQKSKSKRKRDEQNVPSTPSKRLATTSQNFATPSKQNHGDTILETQHEEALENTPKPLMLGPTPQKNGIFISLFENMPTSTPTPRKALQNLPHTATNVPATPSRSTGAVILPVTPSTGGGAGKRFARTPMSSGRRFLLDQFVTPRKRKSGDEDGEGTPSSIAKKFATPAFFRQYMAPTMESVAEEGQVEEEEVVRRRVPRKPLLKTLSVMIREIREGKEQEIKQVEQQEEDRLDEELDLLRDLERGDGEPVIKRVKKVVETVVEIEERIDRDGFLEVDEHKELSELLPNEEKEGEKKEGVFRRLWKKKGQKRTTKRVTMRPTRSKPTTSDANQEPEEQDDIDDDEFNAEYDKIEDDDDEPFQLTATKRPEGDSVKEKEKPKRKAADRNNYRRLKIKQKNPKGNGRFGRRR